MLLWILGKRSEEIEKKSEKDMIYVVIIVRK